MYCGMTQAELARRIGISTQGMNLIETGNTPDPAASRVREIARVLRVSADFLLGLKDKMDGETVPADADLVHV
jgi:transcriptional regulator with XRE-family HTH domain